MNDLRHLNYKAIFWQAALWSVFCYSPVLGAGTTGASFLDIPTGAGPAAMGSAYTALAMDAYAPIWNPAGLGFIDSIQIAGQHLSYLQSTHDEFLSAVYPLGFPANQGERKRKGGVAFSAQYLGSGDITQTDGAGNTTGSYSDNFGAYSLAYGKEIYDRLALGLTAKWIHATLADVNASAYAVDFGALYRFSEKIDFGTTLTNLGSHLTFLSTGDSLPLTFKVGAAYRPSRRWTFSSDVLVPKSDPTGWRGGIEWKPIEMVGIRTGYRTDTTKDLSVLAGFSTGIGLQLWGQEFAYAWVPYGDLGDTNYFSLVLRFGNPDQRKNMVHYSDHPRRQVVSADSAPDDQQLMQLFNGDETRSKVSQNSNAAPHL